MSEYRPSEARIILNGATLLSLLLIAQQRSGGDKPDIVEFADWLADAEMAQPTEGEWYNTSLPHLLLAVGDVVMGADPEMTRIAFFAASKHEDW